MEENTIDNNNDAEKNGDVSYKKSEIRIIKPKSIEDAQTIANCLRDKIPVVVNFEETPEEEIKNVMDFISGSSYAVNGDMKPVSNRVYIFAPTNISVETPDERKAW